MKKYSCTICGDIFDEAKENIKFADLLDDWVCPLCGGPKSMFQLIEDTNEKIETPSNAIKILASNVAIMRMLERCTNCGMCTNTCVVREDMDFDENSELCVNCGQCIQTCPTRALIPKNDVKRFLDAKREGKICIAYTSPGVRVSIGEVFGKEDGSFELGKLIGILKDLGFDYVFDTTFGADLTIVEEANELVNRLNNNGVLPMFTSCCPAWVKYAEQFYPEILDNISTCKSPIGMMGMAVKKYFCKRNNINEEDTFTVAITPCTAKKFEIRREEIEGTDLVITAYELVEYLKEQKIEYDTIYEREFDAFFKEGSGAGVIFGNTGGVMEAALRTAYYQLTGEDLTDNKIEFKDVRGFKHVKEATIDINGKLINVAVIHQMSSAKKILEEVKNGTSKYHFIEIMNCLGGCIGGGGQPKMNIATEEAIKKKRIESLYRRDSILSVRGSHQNPQIKKIYEEFLEKPGSIVAKELLHTTYKTR